jgi:type I restriction enzyme S subunit
VSVVGELGRWPIAKLGEVVADITVGYVGPMTAEYRPTGLPFLRSQNVRRLRIDPEGLCYISPEFHAKLAKSRLRSGDVVVVRTGDPGTAAVIPGWLEEANCADLVIIRPGEVNADFLAYYINSVASGRIAEVVVGAVQQHFNIGAAKELAIPLPSRAEQDAIAAVLGALDDKIEVNRRMNRSLEELASALFKSWFVDFEPVQAKRDGRRAIGVPDTALDLFPGHFQDTSGGPIPKGWSTSTIGEEVRVVGGSTPRTGEPRFWNGNICWVTPRDLSRLSDPVVLTSERCITEAGLAQISSGLLPPGTVLLSSRAPIGYLAIAEVPVAVYQGFIAMVCEKHLSRHWVLNWTEQSMDEVLARAGGTTFAEISKSNFRTIPVVVPPTEIVAVFDSLAAPLRGQLVTNVKESVALESLRDTLLPALLSGDVTIARAEKTVSGVA